MVLLAKKDSVDQLIQIIHEQNSWYIGVIGITIALFGIAFGITQWFLSSQQAKKIKMEARDEIRREYHLDEMVKDISDLKKDLFKLRSVFEKDKFERETSLESLIFEKIDLFVTVSSDAARATISNSIMNYLDEFRLFNIDDYIKDKMFDMFNHKIESVLSNNELNDYSQQMLNASKNVINKMQIELRKKSKSNTGSEK